MFKKNEELNMFSLSLQITRKRKCLFVLSKTRFWGTAADPLDAAEVEPELTLRLATYGDRTGGQDDMSLKELPQNMKANHFSPTS